MSLRFMGNLFVRGFVYSLVCTSTVFSVQAQETWEFGSEDGTLSLDAFLDAEISVTAENEVVQQENTSSMIPVSEETASVALESLEALETLEIEKEQDALVTQDIESVSENQEYLDAEDVKLAHASNILVQHENEAPLEAPVRWANVVKQSIISDVKGYTCTITKRERINGILGKEEVMSAKIRHEPFSVYLNFQQPRRFNGREVIYVENANNGAILVHGVGLELLAGTLSLAPNSRMAMKGNRHPITEIGILNLVNQLQSVGKENMENPCVKVNYSNVQIQGRDCVCVEVINSNVKNNRHFYKAHVYVDMDLNMPIKFISWGWGNGRDYPLMEEYTYSNIQLNPELTDMDFDVRNPKYNYRESR